MTIHDESSGIRPRQIKDSRDQFLWNGGSHLVVHHHTITCTAIDRWYWGDEFGVEDGCSSSRGRGHRGEGARGVPRHTASAAQQREEQQQKEIEGAKPGTKKKKLNCE